MNFPTEKIAVSLIMAVSRNGVIGSAGAMPWHLPGDLRYFQKTTMGKPVIMGQKTWASLKRRPLFGRMNIVLTRQKKFSAKGAHIAGSLEEALCSAQKQAKQDGVREIFIIGGAAVFNQALPSADKIYVTEILADIAGDTFFKLPQDSAKWRKEPIFPVERAAADSHEYRLYIYHRR